MAQWGRVSLIANFLHSSYILYIFLIWIYTLLRVEGGEELSTELSIALLCCLLGAKSGAGMNLMGAREVTTNLLPYICFLSFGSSSSDLFLIIDSCFA